MTKHARLLGPTALALLSTVCAPAAFAQQGTQPERQAEAQRRDAQRAQAEAQRGQARTQRAQAQAQCAQANGDQADIQCDLQKAREDLQEAAREVARLSAQLVDPVVKDVTRQFRFTQHRGMLGLAIEDTELGVRVTGVTPNGAGAEAGVAVGDTIVAIDGADLVSPPASSGKRQSPSQLLMAQLQNVKAGDDVELRVLRNGDYRTVKVNARAPSWDVFVNPNFPNLPNLPNLTNVWPDGFWRHNVWSDLQLATLNPGLGEYFGTKEGLLVVRAPKDSVLGLKDGDVILEIAGRKPTSPEHAMRILASFEPGETLRLSVMRHQKRETVEGKVPTEPAR
jgi:S1-C subfamily serine protease